MLNVVQINQKLAPSQNIGPIYYDNNPRRVHIREITIVHQAFSPTSLEEK